MPGDVLKISAVGTLQDQPINDFYLVEQAGTVALGPAYGRVKVKGLSLVEAEKTIQESLKNILRQPEVSVTLAVWVDRSATPSPLPVPYIIGLGDTLRISAVGTIPDQPIDDLYVVEPMGTVALSPVYGRVNVKGLSIEQAEKTVEDSLKKILREPTVSISLARWNDPSKNTISPQPHRIAPGDILDIWVNGAIPDQPIHGPYLVESDGQVTLGPAYGRVNLKGFTFEEAENIVTKQLKQILRQPEVSITLKGWRGMPTPSAKETTPRYRSPTRGKAQLQARVNVQTENQQLPPFEISTPWPRSELEKYLSPARGEQEVKKPLGQNPPGEKAEATKEEKRDENK
jgi:protein involved in polysaccharide export with SLBB domain